LLSVAQVPNQERNRLRIERDEIQADHNSQQLRTNDNRALIEEYRGEVVGLEENSASDTACPGVSEKMPDLLDYNRGGKRLREFLATSQDASQR